MYEILKRGRHKKASLSLSINAIVILVLAIAMLGLGLAFTKGMFQKFSSKLTVPPPDIPATAEEPIILPSDELEIKHGKEFVFSVNYYNDYSEGMVEPAIECTDYLVPTQNTIGISTQNMHGCTLAGKDCSVIAAAQNVDSGQYKGFKFIVPGRATSTANVGQDVCVVKFCAPSGDDANSIDIGFYDAQECVGKEETKQIVIKVI